MSKDNKLTEKPVREKTPKKKRVRREKAAKLKNQLLLRRGGFSLLITVLFLAVVILFNMLISALSDRFDLEYDLSADKQSTVTKENIEYIKEIDTPISVIVCAGEENYVTYMTNYASQLYGLMDDYQEYYQQTVLFINKYHEYNDKIDVQFIDMYNDSEFSEIYYKYSTDSISYGDIIVSANIESNGTTTERHKVITFKDIYELVEDSSYSQYAMMYGSGSAYTVSGNNIESALSGAIEYVLGVDKSAVLLTGHSPDSAETYYAAYEELLTSNNFDVVRMDGTSVNALPENCDVVVIIHPDVDFQPGELELLSDFLYNGGALQKSLVYVGGTTVQALPNLNEFLADWGINVGEGKLFETSGSYCVAGDPTTLAFRSSTYGAVTSSENAPITVGTAVDSSTEAQIFIPTPDSTVVAPVGAGNDWNDYTAADQGTYALMAVSMQEGMTEDGKDISSAVFAFASADFISPKASSTNNTQYALLAVEALSDSGVSEISFTPKTITSDSFTPSESGSRAIQWIFVTLLPIAMLVIAVVIYIRRKNAK